MLDDLKELLILNPDVTLESLLETYVMLLGLSIVGIFLIAFMGWAFWLIVQFFRNIVHQ